MVRIGSAFTALINYVAPNKTFEERLLDQRIKNIYKYVNITAYDHGIDSNVTHRIAQNLEAKRKWWHFTTSPSIKLAQTQAFVSKIFPETKSDDFFNTGIGKHFLTSFQKLPVKKQIEQLSELLIQKDEAPFGMALLKEMSKNPNIKEAMKEKFETLFEQYQEANNALIQLAQKKSNYFAILFTDYGLDKEKQNRFNNWTPLHFITNLYIQGKIIDASFESLFQNTYKEEIILIEDTQGKKFLESLNIDLSSDKGKKIARFILANIKDPNNKNAEGDTRLHQLAALGYAQEVQLMLKHRNIDSTIKNNAGKTALQLAQEKQFTTVVELFSNENAST
jgi:hypothetical protein